MPGGKRCGFDRVLTVFVISGDSCDIVPVLLVGRLLRRAKDIILIVEIRDLLAHHEGSGAVERLGFAVGIIAGAVVGDEIFELGAVTLDGDRKLFKQGAEFIALIGDIDGFAGAVTGIDDGILGNGKLRNGVKNGDGGFTHPIGINGFSGYCFDYAGLIILIGDGLRRFFGRCNGDKHRKAKEHNQKNRDIFSVHDALLG